MNQTSLSQSTSSTNIMKRPLEFNSSKLKTSSPVIKKQEVLDLFKQKLSLAQIKEIYSVPRNIKLSQQRKNKIFENFEVRIKTEGNHYDETSPKVQCSTNQVFPLSCKIPELRPNKASSAYEPSIQNYFPTQSNELQNLIKLSKNFENEQSISLKTIPHSTKDRPKLDEAQTMRTQPEHELKLIKARIIQMMRLWEQKEQQYKNKEKNLLTQIDSLQKQLQQFQLPTFPVRVKKNSSKQSIQ